MKKITFEILSNIDRIPIIPILEEVDKFLWVYEPVIISHVAITVCEKYRILISNLDLHNSQMKKRKLLISRLCWEDEETIAKAYIDYWSE